MRVYLAAAMTTPASEIETVQRLLAAIEAADHVVPTRHVAEKDGILRDSDIANHELAQRDLTWVTGCDALVAEVSTPSHGVGIEVMAARAEGMPVLLLARQGIRVSRLLLGLSGIETAVYSSPGEACALTLCFLARQRPGAAAGA
jgi:2'-deoxynucleoside 5'-phosphate N-hydrolase